MASVYQNKRVLLGVTGGIAAYKAADLASRLIKSELEVKVLMTDAARRFIQPLTFSALTGNPVPGDMFSAEQEVTIGHIDLARWADIMVVAPATANFLAKAACGLGDDLLSTVVLATRAPLLVAPAMNPMMWDNRAVQENVERLKNRGVEITGPASGVTACGEEGLGRMEEPADIAEEIYRLLSPQSLAGVKVLVTAGPTREHLDPVRFISNPSSGLMGLEAALACRRWGRGGDPYPGAHPFGSSQPYPHHEGFQRRRDVPGGDERGPQGPGDHKIRGGERF